MLFAKLSSKKTCLFKCLWLWAAFWPSTHFWRLEKREVFGGNCFKGRKESNNKCQETTRDSYRLLFIQRRISSMARFNFLMLPKVTASFNCYIHMYMVYLYYLTDKFCEGTTVCCCCEILYILRGFKSIPWYQTKRSKVYSSLSKLSELMTLSL